jgi:hypothetical protein
MQKKKTTSKTGTKKTGNKAIGKVSKKAKAIRRDGESWASAMKRAGKELKK